MSKIEDKSNLKSFNMEMSTNRELLSTKGTTAPDKVTAPQIVNEQTTKE